MAFEYIGYQLHDLGDISIDNEDDENKHLKEKIERLEEEKRQLEEDNEQLSEALDEALQDD